ncbi:MAG: undecaprenyl-diphosphate phosphatase, partial [Epsilonproteobacteria bacterium]|nr:undecaprenyl-diphosphate phosphatase [Campylobacterota bacterium]
PISSTGHMIIVSQWLGLPQNSENKAFEVIIQLASILAIVLNYKDKFNFKEINLWSKIFVAFLPLAIIGFIFRHQIKELFSVQIVAIMFVIGGIVFLVVEKFYKEKHHHISDIEEVSFKQALFIGIAQVFALIPGTSRSGATIIGGLLSGLSRQASAEFSFLLAFPVMLAASGYDILKHYNEFVGQNMVVLLSGFVTAFVVAYITMRLFLKFLEKFTFVAFGWYRIVFGIVLLYFYGGING